MRSLSSHAAPHWPPLLQVQGGRYRHRSPQGPPSLRSRWSLRPKRPIYTSQSLQVRDGLRFHQDQQAACVPSDLETRCGGTRSHDPGSRPYHAGPWPSLPLSEHLTSGVVLTGVLTAGAPQNPVHGMLGLGITLLLWGGTVGQVASSPSQRPGWF